MTDMDDDVYAEDDQDEIDYRLFFVNKECDECPMHIFDFETEEWKETRLKPKFGDRVVKDGTELFCMGNNKYRELGQNEESVWDYSEPEAAKIENLNHARSSDDLRSRRSDPHIDPSSLIQHLRRW